MKSSVIIFPGSNCDRDMDVALKKYGFNNKMVWHNDPELPKSDLIVLPGGFSYGDYLRCGSIAAKSKIIKSVIDFAQSGGLIIGICNGFQILIETGLLPGALLRNKYLKFICKNVFVKINISENKYFKNIKKSILELHIAHNEGNYFCSDEELKSINDTFEISGRGELMLEILLTQMRREGFEMTVSPPKVLYQQDENGNKLEPIEEITIDLDEEHSSKVIDSMNRRKGKLIDLKDTGKDKKRLIFHAPTRGLMGYTSRFLTLTKGNGVINRIFHSYGKYEGEMEGRRNGALISMETGKAVAFAIFNASPPSNILSEGMP